MYVINVTFNQQEYLENEEWENIIVIWNLS